MPPGISPFGIIRASPRFAIDVQEKDNEYIVYAALPGVSPQRVNIQAQGNTLWLSGDIPEEQPKEAGEWLLLERPAGHFERMLTFPANVSTDQARAEFRFGMLVVELPKGRAGREIPIRQIQQSELERLGQRAQQPGQLTAQRQAGVAQRARQQGAKVMEEQGAMPMGSGQGPEQQAGQVRSGMTVYGTNGNEIGMVKEIRPSDFLVSRSLHRDIYVPLNAVQNVSNDQVYLNIPSDQVDDMNWPSPPMFGGSSS
jgi:HSP20 family protein